MLLTNASSYFQIGTLKVRQICKKSLIKYQMSQSKTSHNEKGFSREDS